MMEFPVRTFNQDSSLWRNWVTTTNNYVSRALVIERVHHLSGQFAQRRRRPQVGGINDNIQRLPPGSLYTIQSNV